MGVLGRHRLGRLVDDNASALRFRCHRPGTLTTGVDRVLEPTGDAWNAGKTDAEEAAQDSGESATRQEC